MSLAQQLNDIMQMALDAGMTHAAIISQSDITYDTVFRDICASNSCGNYGMCHMCPPDIGDINTLIAAAKGYTAAVLYQTISEIEDSYDFEGMMDAGKHHSDCSQQLRESLENAKYSNVLHLSCGGCRVCDRCSKRDQLPCRFPEKALASLEAYGMNVYETSSHAGLKYVNGPNTVTYFGIVLVKENQNA